jgi:hypothetical protein
LVAAEGRAVALVFTFFSCGEDFLRSSLGPGWLELPIFDCRLLMDIGRSCHTTFSIVNRQSAIGNEYLVFGLRLRAALCHCLRFAKSSGHHPQRTRRAVADSIHPVFWLYQRVAEGAAVSI